MSDKKRSGAIAIIGVLFFVFGFVTWLNGPLITYVKLAFGLNTDSKAFLVTTAFYMAYFFLALPSSWILKKTGMKKGMALGLTVMAAGTFVFGHFATHRDYFLSLAGLFIIGSGLSLLQTASNPYVSILGPIESAARRISIMGICNKVAGIISPMLISVFILKNVDQLEAQVSNAVSTIEREIILDEFASKIYIPYIIMALCLLILALWISRSPLPEINAGEVNKRNNNDTGEKKDNIFNFPHLWLGALCIFVYVGVEVMAGDAIGTYGRGFLIPADQTKYFTSLTLIAMLTGYIIGIIVIPKYISQQTALWVSAVLGILFTSAAYLSDQYMSVAFVALLGLANAMMWPAIFPLAISGLGRATEKGSAILIMGIAGGAIIPKLFAGLKEHYHFQSVFFVLMVPCYLYILYYAVWGHLAGKRNSVSPVTDTV